MGTAILLNKEYAESLGTVTLTETQVAIPITALTILSKPSTITDSVQLSVSKTPTNTTQTTVTWSSSNNSIATVSATGFVTVVAAGSVTITATSASNSAIHDSFTATCSTTSTVIPITALTILSKPSSITDSVQLSVSKTPSNTTQTGVTWSSSNTSVATVNSSGLVTVVAAGSVTITATSSSNSSIADSFTATCTKTVIAVSSVAVSGDASVNVGSNLQLYADVLPANASNKTVTWSSSDPTKATVNSSGLVTGVSAGSVTITATSSSDATKVGTKSITVAAVVATKILLKQAYSVLGSLSWYWVDPKTGRTINRTYQHSEQPSTVKDITGAVVSGIQNMNTAALTAVDSNIIGNGSFSDQPLTDSDESNCEFSLSTIKNISTPHSYEYNTLPAAMGVTCPNGSYHYRILLGCTVSKTTEQATLKINNTVITLPVFNVLDNLSTYVEGTVTVTTGYLVFVLGKKTGNYDGQNPVGISLIEITKN